MPILHYLSPAKSLSFAPASSLELALPATQPRLLGKSSQLLPSLLAMDEQGLKELMGISDGLAKMNHARFRSLGLPLSESSPQCRRSIFCFNGDAYEGLDPGSLSEEALTRLSSGCRILSGYYGLLRPHDLMRAYRLEMGRRPMGIGFHSLYAFWGSDIAKALSLDADAQGAESFLSLASEEYDRAASPQLALIDARPIHAARFESQTDAGRKVISFEAKRARGLFARHLAMGMAEDIEEACESFATEGWRLDKKEPLSGPSSPSRWVFLRTKSNA